MRYRHWAGIGAGIILGLIFITSGVGKILEPTEFLTALTSTSFLTIKLSILIAKWLPWVELLLGLSLIVGISAKFMSSVSFMLVIGFIFHNAWLITHGLATDDCGCLGGFGNMLEIERQITLSSQNALYMDIGMVALILVILFCYPGKFFTTRPWFQR
ncbi:MauE/DoxX family redox-associated membrane protein [Chloroflexota bacterium]